MQVITFANQFGPAQVWLLDGSDVPPSAFIPPAPDERAQVMAYKGSGLTWAQWARHLEVTTPPDRGSWGLQDVPDGLTAHQALVLVRQRAIAGVAS